MLMTYPSGMYGPVSSRTIWNTTEPGSIELQHTIGVYGWSPWVNSESPCNTEVPRSIVRTVLSIHLLRPTSSLHDLPIDVTFLSLTYINCETPALDVSSTIPSVTGTYLQYNLKSYKQPPDVTPVRHSIIWSRTPFPRWELRALSNNNGQLGPTLAKSNRLIRPNLVSPVISSIISSLLSISMTYPWETLKLVMQIHPEIPTGKSEAVGLVGAWKIVVGQGYGLNMFNLFQGYGWSLLGCIPTQLSNFILRGPLRQRLRGVSLVVRFGLIGLVPGALSMLVTYPIEARRMAIAAGIPVSKKILFNYSGFCVSLFDLILYRMIYFALFDASRRLQRPTRPPSLIVSLVTGVITYPCDTLRRRMIIAAVTGNPYSGAFACALTMWRQGGLSAFFAGARVAVFGKLLAAAIFMYRSR